MSSWAAALFLGIVRAVAMTNATSHACLVNGVPAAKRSYLQDDDGQNFPLGLLEYDWPSARLLSRIAATLLEEELGYHVVLQHRTASFMESLRQLAGCAEGEGTGILGREPDGVPQTVRGNTVRPCSAEARCHVALDSPLGRNEHTHLAFRAATPLTAPEDIGSMGYFSEQNLAVSLAVRAAAYEDTGLALDYYQTYNQSLISKYRPLFQASAYFDELSRIDRAEVFECTEAGLEFTDPIKMAAYLKWTGDVEGVVLQADGSYVAKCPDGHFWLAPSCRHNTSQCIPTFTTGNGWLVDAFMQWSAHHGIPLAIGISRTAALYFEHVSQIRSLFFWWRPDPTFREASPLAVLFPRHSGREWAVGDKRTATTGQSVRKLVSANLRLKAPRVQSFVSRMTFRFEQLEHLLDQVARLASSSAISEDEAMRTVSCEWIKSNNLTWQDWVPKSTDCAPGFGLVDSQGKFVTMANATATSCQPCPSGYFSNRTHEAYDASGADIAAYICAACPAGSFQAFPGKSECEPCDLGRASGMQGATACDLCPLGTFAARRASTACNVCGAGQSQQSRQGWTTKELVGTGEEASNGTRWIEVRGATSEDFCACVEGRFLDQGRCETCQEGARCLGHTGLTLNPGYFAFPENPGHVYRCFGNGRRCPGGLPGSCAPGRRNSSLTCAECFPGLHDNYDGACVTCNSLDGAILAVLACLLVLGPCAVHTFTLMTQLRSRLGLLEVTLSLGQMVTSAQVLVIIQQGIEWGEPFIRLLESLQFVSMDFLWRILESVNCLTNFTPELRYFTQSLLLPTIFMLVPALTHLVYVRRCRQGKTRKYHLLRKTLGTLSVLFFIPALSSLLAPFRCDVHPNDVQTMQVYQTVSCDFTGSHLRMCLMGGMVSLVLLAFMVLVFWLVYVELPRRLEVFDVDFLRSCSFLWARFRPGAEAFAGAFLVRNALIVVSPLLPSSFASLFFIKVLLYTSFCAVAFFKPLRTMAALYLELVIHAAFLVILDMGMLFMPTEESALVMVACVLISSSVVLIILSMVAHALFLKCRSKYRKQFQFFISHQKSAAGSLARLFKIELSKCGFRSFIDCDDLTDLTRLFLYVSQDVETLVVLGSGNFLTRKWCVGEIVTARLHNVTTLLVALPDFTMPDERFVALYDSMVPNIKELAAYGIGMPEIHETLLWLQCLERFDLKSFDSDPIPGAISWLTGGATKWTRKGSDLPMMRVVSNLSECLILCDAANMEAMAAAQVLFALLGAKMIGLSLKKTLRVLRTGDIVDSEDVHALLLCTEGCLESRQMASWLLQLSFCSSFVLPVLAEDSFQIPFGHELNDEFNEDQDGFDRARYAQVLETIFHETSVPFTPRSSNARQLDLQAKLIAERLQQPVAVQAWRSVSLDSFAGFPDSPGSALASFGFPRVELSEWPTSPTSPASLASPASPTPNVSSNAEDAVLEL